MDVATFETAVKLKEAGFPQPDPEAGQVWYARDETFIFLGRISSGAWTVCSVDYDEVQNIYPNDIVFAPTAADILRELPEGFVLHKRMAVFYCLIIPKIPVGAESIYGTPSGSDTNPAEACAAAWLELKKEQAQ